MNTSTPPPMMGSNVSVDSKSGIGFQNMDMISKYGQQQPIAVVNNPTENHQNNTSSTNSGSATRRLIRTDSTYEEDLFDESIRDLSHLNQRCVLRQQWFRKNNLVNRLRRSTSTASNSSSSSSGISSNLYSSCNATNTSSFGSSFSSSFSATLSSLSESCDNDTNVSPIGISSIENDYPKILRKSSFKNKLIHCYKPYYKPRRLSLQLLKNNLESPENLKLYSSSTRSSFVPRSMMKYSMSFHSIGNKDKRCLFAMSSSSTKSNPSSPNKNIGGYMGTANNQCSNDISQTMNTTHVITIDSSDTEQNQHGIINTSVVSGMVRSKSLDDLNTLFCCPSVCSSNCLGHDTDTAIAGAVNTGNTLQPAASITHYSSFSRICDSPKNVQPQGTDLGPATNTTSNYFTGTANNHHHLAPINQMTAMSCFNPINGNNLKGISISSSQINYGNNGNSNNTNSCTNNTTNNNSSSSSSTLTNNQQQNNTTNNQLQTTVTNNSLCDIDHVMKKISSLRV